MGRPKGSWHGAANPNWKGGIRTNADGRVFILKPEHPNARQTGYVRRSVLVVSEHLQRPIAPNEVVHHINGQVSDDRLENLILLTRAIHTSHHHKGLIKPNSLKNLTHIFTDEERKHYWETKGKERRIKPRICDYCEKTYLPKSTPFRKFKHHYCSKHCAGKANPSLPRFNTKRRSQPPIS